MSDQELDAYRRQLSAARHDTSVSRASITAAMSALGRIGGLRAGQQMSKAARHDRALKAAAGRWKHHGPSWTTWYREARAEMVLRYGVRGVPQDTYKTEFAQGRTVIQAVKAIAVQRGIR